MQHADVLIKRQKCKISNLCVHIGTCIVNERQDKTGQNRARLTAREGKSLKNI